MQMDSTLTWNITCPLGSDDVTVADIVAKALYDGMNPLLPAGELRSVYVYELCGNTVGTYSPYPHERRLQTETDIKFMTIMTSLCNSCENDMGSDADAALGQIISDGSLTDSIHQNSGNTITAVIGDVYTTKVDPMSNPPTSAPITSASPSFKPTASPTISPSTIPKSILVYSVDICYEGCGNFTNIYTHEEFETIILKYAPCHPAQCYVTVVDEAASLCEPCSNSLTRKQRNLQITLPQIWSSEVIFDIRSHYDLNQTMITLNLNSNVDNINNDLNAISPTFTIDSSFTAATDQPTLQPVIASPTPPPTPEKAPPTSSQPTPKPTRKPRTRRPTPKPLPRTPKPSKASNIPGAKAVKPKEPKGVFAFSTCMFLSISIFYKPLLPHLILRA